MEQRELEILFARAFTKENVFLNLEERQIIGARIFKRKALGLCGYQVIKTLDEMAQLLCDTSIVSSIDEGKTLTPLIMGGKVSYVSGGGRGLVFDQVKDGKGNIGYSIRAYHSY